MFWWLLTPFVGHDLGKATAELDQKTVDKVIERCVELAHHDKMAACAAVQHNALAAFRTGAFGSTVPDQVRIFELEQTVKLQEAIIETQQVAFDRMSWIAQQDGE
jgi:hypothetical protein